MLSRWPGTGLQNPSSVGSTPTGISALAVCMAFIHVKDVEKVQLLPLGFDPRVV